MFTFTLFFIHSYDEKWNILQELIITHFQRIIFRYQRINLFSNPTLYFKTYFWFLSDMLIFFRRKTHRDHNMAHRARQPSLFLFRSCTLNNFQNINNHHFSLSFSWWAYKIWLDRALKGCLVKPSKARGQISSTNTKIVSFKVVQAYAESYSPQLYLNFI